MGDSYSPDELKQLRGVIEADAYRALDAKAPSYQRLAMLYEGLRHPPDEIGDAYLTASWQTEEEQKAESRHADEEPGVVSEIP